MAAQIYSRCGIVTNAKIAAELKKDKKMFQGFIHYKGIYDIEIEYGLNNRFNYKLWLLKDKDPKYGGSTTLKWALENLTNDIYVYDRDERIRMLND